MCRGSVHPSVIWLTLTEERQIMLRLDRHIRCHFCGRVSGIGRIWPLILRQSCFTDAQKSGNFAGKLVISDSQLLGTILCSTASHMEIEDAIVIDKSARIVFIGNQTHNSDGVVD